MPSRPKVATGQRATDDAPSNASIATKPDAAGSSSPSTTSDVRSGAASYIASSTAAFTFFDVEPHACPSMLTRTRTSVPLTRNERRFGAHLVETRTDLRQFSLHPSLQLLWMKPIKH